MAETFTEIHHISKFDDLDTPTAAKLNANWDGIDARLVFFGTTFPTVYPLGKLFLKTNEPALYFNTGTHDVPVWTPLSASGVIKADGSVPFAGDQSMGGFNLTDLEDPESAQDAATMAYVDARSSLIFVDPNLETFAWRNQDGATATPSGKSILFSKGPVTSTNLSIYKRSSPTLPFSFEAAFQVAFPLHQTFLIFGITFLNVAGGGHHYSVGVGYTANDFSEMSNGNLTSFTVNTQVALKPFADQATVFLKGTDDGTTMKFYSSINGKDWVFVCSRPHSDTIWGGAFGVTDEIGVYMVNDTVSVYPTLARLIHWTVY